MKRILIVDDTKNIRFMLTKCLELEGYQVTAASDGREALELFEKESFDLAFLDIKLPEVRGTEVLRRIRELGITTPVIIITAYATVKNAVDCTKMGAVAYLQKPFTADKIKSVMNEIYSCDLNTQGITFNNKFNEAKLLILHGNYLMALELLKSELANDLENSDLYLQISQCYKGMGEMEKADKFYNASKAFNTN